MCCLKIDTETLLANCLNTCKTYSFSPDDLQQIVRLMANCSFMLMKTGLLCAASGSTMTRSCRWRISTLDTPPLTSSNCAPQRKNTAPRKMNSCQVVRVA